MTKRRRAAGDSDWPDEQHLRPFLEIMDFDLVEWKRCTSLVMLQMLLDEALTLRLLVHIDPTAPSHDFLLQTVSSVNFDRRVRLAADEGVISKKLANDIRALNELRSSLLHFEPRRRRRRSTEGVPALTSANAFNEMWNRGVLAIHELTTAEGMLKPRPS